MSLQPGLVESINLVSDELVQLKKDMEATNSPYKNDRVPLNDDIATWLRENERFEQLTDGTWAISRTNLHEAIAAVKQSQGI